MAQIPCPECGRLARIVDRFTMIATGGPAEHLKVVCPGGHVLMPLVEDLWPRRAMAQRIASAEDHEHAEAPRFARQM
jgi:hypothetical protein